MRWLSTGIVRLNPFENNSITLSIILIKRYKSAMKRTAKLETSDEIYEEEDIKEIVDDVLNELYSKTKNAERQ